MLQKLEGRLGAVRCKVRYTHRNGRAVGVISVAKAVAALVNVPASEHGVIEPPAVAFVRENHRVHRNGGRLRAGPELHAPRRHALGVVGDGLSIDVELEHAVHVHTGVGVPHHVVSVAVAAHDPRVLDVARAKNHHLQRVAMDLRAGPHRERQAVDCKRAEAFGVRGGLSKRSADHRWLGDAVHASGAAAKPLHNVRLGLLPLQLANAQQGLQCGLHVLHLIERRPVVVVHFENGKHLAR
mmetsp:Transcript_22161/g.57799  ORF Transcript_22161/g.57799 Transcript_22161/m.57799 type:complete len:240 (-) Transcript_22161:3415-4134(-)